MATYKFGDSEGLPPSEQLTGDYRFEVVGFDTGLQGGQGKTAGSEKLEIKLRFFRDEAFQHPCAQWTEDLIIHELTAWKIDLFVKAANLLINGRPPAKDES